LTILLLVVALSAAVLSFDALQGLALVCGFDARLAWLLPVVVDAGAAAGSLVWLGAWAPAPARRFARVLALLLLGGSVAGNALGHGLAAFRVAAPWWVVVLVSAVAPAVLGAVVHLAVLASGREREPGGATPLPPGEHPAGEPRESLGDTGRERVGEQLDDGWEIEHREEQDLHAWLAPAPAETPAPAPAGDRVGELLAAGAGRRKLSRELGISEHEARQLLAGRTNGAAR
jgi:hypothetical protein